MDFPTFRKNFTTKELATYMVKEFNIDEEIVTRIIDEEIDGIAFLELKEVDLRELGIRKMGILKKLLLLIRQASTSQTIDQAVSAASPKPPSAQNPDLRNAVMEVMKSLNQIPNHAPTMRPMTNFSHGSTAGASHVIVSQGPRSAGHMGQIGGSYAGTSPISMTARAVKSAKIPSTFKAPPMNSLAPPRMAQGARPYRWQERRPPPALVTASESTRSQRKAAAPQRYVSTSKETALSSEPHAEVKIEPTSPRSEENDVTSIQDDATSTHNDVINKGSKVDAIASQVANSIAESSREGFVRVNLGPSAARKRSYDDEDDDDGSPMLMKVMSLEKAKKYYRPFDGYVLPPDATFENLNLCDEITKMPGGKDTVDVMRTEGRFDNLSHRRFMKKAVHILELVSQKMGFRKYYPPNYVKVIMAKKIVSEIPILGYNDLGKAAHTTYFDASDRSGFIENRLKTLRRSLNIEDKAYKPRSKGKHGYQDYDAASNFNVIPVPEDFDVRSESGEDAVESYAAGESLGSQSLEEVDGCEGREQELDQMFNTFFKE